MKYKWWVIIVISLTAATAFGQNFKGSLFIIGGGERPLAMMQQMIATAQLQVNDYIVVLPMSGSNADTSFFYIREDIRKACNNAMLMFNFTKATAHYQPWLDSLQHAKLVFITGGDQNRFMDIVLHTPIHQAIKKAFANGATIAGTSAGAAVMSQQMITGNELLKDSIGSGPFTQIKYNMVEIKEGLGLVTTAIIDQHFIVRSRYNRLLSVLAANPTVQCIGIDEATAIIIKGKKVTVTGESQVIRMRLPLKKKAPAVQSDKVRLQQVQLDVLSEGDAFMLDSLE